MQSKCSETAPSKRPAGAGTPAAAAREESARTQEQCLTARPRDTGWKTDGRAHGIYWRRRVGGSKSWGFYADGQIHTARTRPAAIDGKARATLRRSAGLPPRNARVRIRDLAAEVRETKRRTLRSSSFTALERALDNVLLPELGHLKPADADPDRIAQLIRDLEDRGHSPATIRRYLSPLGPIFKLAVRRGLVATSPLELLSDEERPTGGGIRDHYIWSAEEIRALIAAADELGRRPEANYNYAPLIQLLAVTGLRVGEALALQWGNVDLEARELRVRASLCRTGELTPPKTKAGTRTVPLSTGLVDLLTRMRPLDVADDEFVFMSKRGGRPIAYGNFRIRGFEKALMASGLGGRGITIHGLRSAAASVLIRQGLTPVEVAHVLGHADPNITLKVYARLFDRPDFATRVRSAQSLVQVPIAQSPQATPSPPSTSPALA